MVRIVPGGRRERVGGRDRFERIEESSGDGAVYVIFVKNPSVCFFVSKWRGGLCRLPRFPLPFIRTPQTLIPPPGMSHAFSRR